jgi:hypothetical protein
VFRGAGKEREAQRGSGGGADFDQFGVIFARDARERRVKTEERGREKRVVRATPTVWQTNFAYI